jgi:hypothetical protein
MNYGNMNDPSAEQELKKIAGNSPSITDYSLSIFDESSLKSIAIESDDNVMLKNYHMQPWSAGRYSEDRQIDRAYRVYCDVKYSAEEDKGENIFCVEKLNTGSDTIIIKYIEKSTKFIHAGPFNYRYEIIYKENRNSLIFVIKDAVKQLVNKRIQNIDKEERIVKAAKNGVSYYSASFSPVNGVTVDYELSGATNYGEISTKSSKLNKLTRSVKNNTHSPYLLNFGTGVLLKGKTTYAITYSQIDGNVAITSNCPILQAEQSVLVNPGITCSVDLPITVSGFAPDQSSFTIKYLNQLKSAKVTKPYELDKKYYDNIEKENTQDIKNLRKNYFSKDLVEISRLETVLKKLDPSISMEKEIKSLNPYANGSRK